MRWALPSVGHAAAGLWMGWAYRRITDSPRCRQHGWSFLLAWAGALVVYYAGVL
ncbi:MAG: hypothetical protein HZB16_14785 [Armatimonadetes bacterium]|nr:hypothetical protein [Armatimonadota bacterium]